MTEEAGNVSYTVKELLARLDGKLDGLMLLVNSKAEKQDLDILTGRVSSLETQGSFHAQKNAETIKENNERLNEVEKQLASSNGVTIWLWRAMPVLIALASLIVALRIQL